METQEIILTSHRIFLFQADYLKGNHFILGKNYFLFSFYKKMHLHSSYFLSRKAYILLFIYIHFLHPYDFSPQSLGKKKTKPVLRVCVCVWAMFWLSPGIFMFQRHDKILQSQGTEKEFQLSPRHFGVIAI